MREFFSVKLRYKTMIQKTLEILGSYFPKKLILINLLQFS